MEAYVCRISEENFAAIASEKPDFNKDELIEWLTYHGQGFFLRDPSSVFDCGYLVDDVLLEMYMFDSADASSLFRRVLKL